LPGKETAEYTTFLRKVNKNNYSLRKTPLSQWLQSWSRVEIKDNRHQKVGVLGAKGARALSKTQTINFFDSRTRHQTILSRQATAADIVQLSLIFTSAQLFLHQTISINTL